jgi:ABC-type antimicrobial peptide transport system permease subunit
LSLVIGLHAGADRGLLRRKVDGIIMRLADVMLAFPSLLLAMVVMYILGATLLNCSSRFRSSLAGTARVVRAQTLALKEKEFIEAARSMGVSRGKIMFRHILTNCVPSLIVRALRGTSRRDPVRVQPELPGRGAQRPPASWGPDDLPGQEVRLPVPVAGVGAGHRDPSDHARPLIFWGMAFVDAMDPYLKT